MEKHYTILDFFGKKFTLKHPAGSAFSIHLPDDLTFMCIEYLNPKPGDTAPVPKKIVWDWEDEKLYDGEKKAFRLIVWYGLYIEPKECGQEPIEPETMIMYVSADMKFGHAEFIPGEYKVTSSQESWGGPVEIESYMGTMEDIHDDTKTHVGIWFSDVAPIYKGGEPAMIYLDPCRKQPVEIGDEYKRYDPEKAKKIYVDYSNYYEFQKYRIYMPVFAHLLKIGKSIEDLNYATEIEFSPGMADDLGCNSQYMTDEWPYGVTDLSQWRIKITFGTEKLRDLKYEDYENNVILYEYNTDLTEYVEDSMCEKKGVWKIHKDWYGGKHRQKFFWSGIPYNYKCAFILGNFCSHIGFNTEERCFGMGGECG
jgi:hypothetical protein